MEKEPLTASTRFRMAMATVVLELGILFLPTLGIDIELELLNTIALSIAGIMASMIYGRSIRNTPN